MKSVSITGTRVNGSTGEFEVDVFEEEGVIKTQIRSWNFINLDLTPLSSLVNLQSLEIIGNDNLTSLDLTPLSSLTSLQILSIIGNRKITDLDLTPLASLSDLQILSIGGNESLTHLDLSPLSSLFSLQGLGISGNTSLIHLDLFPLSSQINLRNLVISRNLKLESLDLTPLSLLRSLQQLEISYNDSLTCLDLAPLSSLESLQGLDIWSNYFLRRLDLTPLSSLTSLQNLRIVSSETLIKLDLTPLSSLTRLQNLYIQTSNNLRSLDLTFLVSLPSLQNLEVVTNKHRTNLSSFLSSSTLKKIVPYINKLQDVFFTFTPLNSFNFISHLAGIVEKDEPSWKMNHLIQETLKILDLEWLGLLDIEHDVFVSIIKDWKSQDFIKTAKETFVKNWIKQVDAGGTTIGVPIDVVPEIAELISKKDEISNQRYLEMERLTLFRQDDVIDLRPLHLTAYGYQVLDTLKGGLSCSDRQFEGILKELEGIGFAIGFEEQEIPDAFTLPPHKSNSLAQYIFKLVEERRAYM